jgi:hypothetical protein
LMLGVEIEPNQWCFWCFNHEDQSVQRPVDGRFLL